MKKEVENLLNEILSYLNCTEISSSDYETIENKINMDSKQIKNIFFYL